MALVNEVTGMEKMRKNNAIVDHTLVL